MIPRQQMTNFKPNTGKCHTQWSNHSCTASQRWSKYKWKERTLWRGVAAGRVLSVEEGDDVKLTFDNLNIEKIRNTGTSYKNIDVRHRIATRRTKPHTYTSPPPFSAAVNGCCNRAAAALSANGRSFPPPGRLGLLQPRHRQSRQDNLISNG
jgi:hypothetical protein